MKLAGKSIPVEIYHAVPKGWSKSEIIAAYKLLGGKNLTTLSEDSEPGAPSWLPDRYNWLQYRATLKALPDLIRKGDAAAAEVAIRYIELNYIGSYSGYLRARLARALKSYQLNQTQKSRLIDLFSELSRNRMFLSEHKEYVKLANAINRSENV